MTPGTISVTRFAPSPTGYLHLGHVVNAIYVWGVASALDGHVLVRIEDHDRTRCKPEYERAILDDLSWLGFRDMGAPPLTTPFTRQSERHALYDKALRHLRAAGQVYACDCTRKRITGEHYDGYCRDRDVPERRGTGLRVRLEPGVERFDDRLLGPLEQSPSDQCGDLLIRDRHGHWTYQFAVTVDDLAQGITLVIRGADLVDSTGGQRRLSRLLMASGAFPEQPLPTYMHHPLVFGADGKKLSKSTGSAGVRVMRHNGMSPSEVIGRAAAAVGLVTAPQPIAADAVSSLFRGMINGFIPVPGNM